MKILLHELADQPLQILGALGTILVSTVAAVMGLVSQIGQELVTEAPTWFLAFVAVVIIACAIVGIYLWGLDQIFRPLVDRVLL